MRDKNAKEDLGTQQSGLQISSQELETALAANVQMGQDKCLKLLKG